MLRKQLLIYLACLATAANTFDIQISPTSSVALHNVSFSPEKSVFRCSSQTHQHQYCCWTSPQNPECRDCDAKGCVLDGVNVRSDQKDCMVTIDHVTEENAGPWTCTLFVLNGDTLEMDKSQASSHLFIINLEEVPQISQIADVEFSEAHDTKEAQFECFSRTKAPSQEYQWTFKNQVLGKRGSSLKLNLTRNDFNQSLHCSVLRKTHDGKPLPSATDSIDLVMRMNPVVLEVTKMRDANYQILVEAWPMPNFVRISAVEKCDNNCVIYKLINEQYVIDTSPYMKETSYVDDVVIMGQVYGAKVRINLLLNPVQLKNLSHLYVGIGNDLNVATLKIDLLHTVPDGIQLTSNHGLKESTLTVAIVVCVVALIMLVAIILGIVYRQRISESFKCGVYLVPHDDEEAIEDDKKRPLQEEGKAPIPPETEF